jgi:hypothetical protein
MGRPALACVEVVRLPRWTQPAAATNQGDLAQTRPRLKVSPSEASEATEATEATARALRMAA